MKTKIHKQPKISPLPYMEKTYSYALDADKQKQKQSEKWKLGDWCICRMKIQQITEVDKDTLLPTTVSCGFISSGSRDWTPDLFPLTLRNKRIAYHFEYLYDELHKKYRNLNFPDLFAHFCNKCDECLAATSEQDVDRLFEEIRDFQVDVSQKAFEALSFEVNGVGIFKR